MGIVGLGPAVPVPASITPRADPMKLKSIALLAGITLTSAAASAAPPGIAPKGPAGPALAPSISWNQWVTMFRDYMDLIDHFAQVSRDPSSAGIAAVVYTDEI